MTNAAERMKISRRRRQARGVREVRIVAADARSPGVRDRVARQVAALAAEDEAAALVWIEEVSVFDDRRPGADAPR